jgi:hypothetical protein
VWTLEATGAAIQAISQSLRATVKTNGATIYRLNGDAIEDLIIVAHYSVS